MKKYFYIDPLAAAWMRAKFGMRFTDSNGTELQWCNEFICFHLPDGIAISQAWDDKHYVHPDSVHLLAQRGGDTVTFYSKSIKQQYFQKLGDNIILDDMILSEASLRVIQRNSIAFMWPEIEA